MAVLLFLLLLTAAALGGYATLSWCGMEDGDAWAAGRTFGLVLVALPAWWCGVAGLTAWRGVGGLAVLAAAGAGLWRLWTRRQHWRAMLQAEAVFLAVTAAILLLRLDHPEILATEKPMDLGILATLLRTEALPPPDFWLAGETLPYYYWGSLLWALPLGLSGLALEVGYNLVVGLVGGLAATSVWRVGRRLSGGSHWAGLTASFFALGAGTPDGMRQLLAGSGLSQLDLWASSRQVPHTITEFPLFSLWLGDLHPHLLSIPLIGAVLLVALHGGRRGVTPAVVTAIGILVGATWSANPWAMPPTSGAVGLLLVCGGGRWRWPTGLVTRVWPVRGGDRQPLREHERQWLAAALVPVLAWVCMMPFHLDFDPPLRGVRWVSAWTWPQDLLLYGGCLLLPAMAAAVVELRRMVGGPELRGKAVVLTWAALAVLVAAISGRLTMVFLAAALVPMVRAAVSRGEDPGRPALALATLGLSLFLLPEIIAVEDGYGEQLHRMNTVFKTYIQAWVLLAAVLPVLLHRWLGDALPRRVLTLFLVSLSLPHLLGAARNGLAAAEPSLDGLRWMDGGERAMVRFLRMQPPGSTLVEAVGDAYSRAARMSAASGVPALLGWANHERVWRGRGIATETRRRDDVVRRIYRCDDPDEVRRLLIEEGVDLVVIGSLERQMYSAAGLERLKAAGRVVFEHGTNAVIGPPADRAEAGP